MIASIAQRQLDARKPPRWMVCDADEFERKWLKGWEKKEIPRPDAEEIARADQWLVSESYEEEEEGSELSEY